jgi:hypothetical protein
MNKDPRETVDFFPTENSAEVVAQVRDWIKANLGALLKDCHATHHLDDYGGGHLYLELGGYVADPEGSKGSLNVEASFNVEPNDSMQWDVIIDPKGDWWYRKAYHATVGWPSYGAHGAGRSRLRAELISAAVGLAERFDAQFGASVVWTRGMTKVEIDEYAAKIQRDTARVLVSGTIREAIHTTCRRMQVGNQRCISAPEGLVPGTYEVEVENKTYAVEVMGTDHVEPTRRFRFRRTK